MEVLRLLSLIYAGVLVLALAVSLIAVLIYLRRIGGVLAETRRSLSLTQQRTLPLEEHLAPLSAETIRIRAATADADEDLMEANEQLTTLCERLKVFVRGAGQEA